MKFGKEFVSQMVPEWQEAYMDYDYLKTLLKEIQLFKQKHTTSPPKPKGLKRRLSLYRTFSGLTPSPESGSTSISETVQPDIENQAIQVNPVAGRHETVFLRAAEIGGENEMVFFRRLDDEFDKVLKFYKCKVEEVVKEAEMLNKQMDGLIAFRIIVDKPQRWLDGSAEMTRLASDVAASTSALSASTSHSFKATGKTLREVLKEDRFTRQEQSDALKEIQEETNTNQKVQEQKPSPIMVARPAPLEILNNVKINNTLETPRSTLKAILNVPHQTKLKFSKENLKKVEEQLKQAFLEFYQKRRVLKSYSFLNMLAFSKILKKYDKIASRNASKQFLKMVENSYLGSSDEVTRLMERVEAAFIKHFANSNRTKGMRILRPKAKTERHRVTFSLGFFAGCTVALILALALIIHARNLLNREGKNQYMETMFPLYSLFGFIILHMVMYAANIYLWRRYRVNYSFIFGFKEGTELGYREVLVQSSALAVLALASVLANLDMEMDPKTLVYKEITELVPLGLVVSVTVILLCPFNIIYRSSRFFLLTSVFHCICAPLYKVSLADHFLADQLTSQVQAFRSLEFYICYYGWGDYKVRENSCKTNDVFNTFYFIVAVIPYWLRLFQCLRHLFEERDVEQGFNGLKYFSTILAVSARTAYTLNRGMSWKIAAWIFSVTAAIFGTYWDLVKDWGLLRPNSENHWLRDKLLIPHRSVYFGAMGLNILLRFAWLQTVLNFRVQYLHQETSVTLVAVLEIFRRGMWNFFRLEFQHLNNVGKYRAFKTVSLPFDYGEDENKEE